MHGIVRFDWSVASYVDVHFCGCILYAYYPVALRIDARPKQGTNCLKDNFY
jgi:hypothetical protein